MSTRFAKNSKNSLFNIKLGMNMYGSDKPSANKIASQLSEIRIEPL